MIIKDNILLQEKDMLTEILFNQKAILIWDFTEIGKVKKR